MDSNHFCFLSSSAHLHYSNILKWYNMSTAKYHNPSTLSLKSLKKAFKIFSLQTWFQREMFIGFDEKKTSDHALHDRCAVTFLGGRNALVLLLKYSIWFHNRKLNIASVSRSSLGIALSEKPETRRRLPRCHCW